MPKWGREVTATLISPPTGLNRAAFGDRFRGIFPSHDPLYFIRASIGFSGGADNPQGTSTTKLRTKEGARRFPHRLRAARKAGIPIHARVRLLLPAGDRLQRERIREHVRARIALGRSYDVGSRYHGVWGLYGNYDYIAPQTYRVSSTGLSLGTTAQWQMSDRWRLVGTITGGVSYTAAGTTGTGASDVAIDNDYHYGMAPQALAVLRFVHRDRLALDLAGREYYVTRAAGSPRGGYVNVSRLEAALTYRVKDHHAVSVRYLFNRRDATFPDAADRLQHRATVGLFYTYLGHDLFGTEEK
jgi:hypothetical protein